MNLFVFGSSLTSTFWNGAATYYRGIYKNLSRLGHRVIFAEPAIYGRQQHRDAADTSYAQTRVYKSSVDIPTLLAEAARADIVIKHSGVGADDELLEREVLTCRSASNRILFWDVDAPATLARLESNAADPFRVLIPRYDAVMTYGGGPPVIAEYRRLGAKECVPIYNALDPETHHAAVADPYLTCDLAFVGHRLPDRESRVEEFFFRAARLAPEMSFVLGGEGWGDKKLPQNVRWVGHVPSDRHNVMNSSARMVLNVNRDSMAKTGFSPPTRVFEAAGSGACVITDVWEGIGHFFEPFEEILVATSGADVVNHLRATTSHEAKDIGVAMCKRALRDHTYGSRAHQVDKVFKELFANSVNKSRAENPCGATVFISSEAGRAV